jgi:large subunit ribosomal protein L9
MSKSDVQVILLHTFQKKGVFGDIIKVKRGYAKNFLIPNKYALYANETNKSKFDLLKQEALENSNKLKEQALKIVEKIKDVNICIVRNSAQDNKIFGTISTKNIADEFKKIGVDIDRNQILISDTIKYLGTYKIKLVLHPDVVFEKEIIVSNGIIGNNAISIEDEEESNQGVDSNELEYEDDEFDN